MDKNCLISVKSKKVAVKIISLYSYLKEEKKEFVMSKQILKSGTSIGANIREAIRAQSPADFKAKLYISLKEAEETEYWLELLQESNILEKDKIDEIYSLVEEIIKLLVVTVKK